jgi:folate-binding protein YgfZ
MAAQVESQKPFFFDLIDRVKLRIRGNDRIRFLNGQLTNDIRAAASSSAMEACVLNAKGKMDGHLFVRAEPESFLLDADVDLRESLQPRLERYIIADDVEIEDVTDRFAIFHVVATAAPTFAVRCEVVSVNRFASPGRDIWIDASSRDQIFGELAKTFSYCNPSCAEIFRIERGIPRWGRELTNEIIPVEANLEERCIDYAKGCYIGQETISRMKMSGQRNKNLCGLVSRDDSPLAAGMRLFAADNEAKEAGWITSTAASERLGKQIALGYVKRGFNASGSSLLARVPNIPGQSAAVEVVDLPFAV